jgi:hypothetical protein
VGPEKSPSPDPPSGTGKPDTVAKPVLPDLDDRDEPFPENESLPTLDKKRIEQIRLAFNDLSKEKNKPKWEQKADTVLRAGLQFIGAPYKFGASSKQTETFDCSSLMRRIFSGVHINLPLSDRLEGVFGLLTESSHGILHSGAIGFSCIKGIMKIIFVCMAQYGVHSFTDQVTYENSIFRFGSGRYYRTS